MANDTNTQSFWEHLDVLRTAIVKIAAVAVVFGIVAFFFKEELFSIVLAPKEDSFVTYQLLVRINGMGGRCGRAVFRQAYQYRAGATVHHPHEDSVMRRSIVYFALYPLSVVPVRFSGSL